MSLSPTPAAKVLAWELDPDRPKDKSFKPDTAQDRWWQWVQKQLADRPVAATTLYKKAEANPPSTPQTGKLKGTCEPPLGWFRFFRKQGLVREAKG